MLSTAIIGKLGKRLAIVGGFLADLELKKGKGKGLAEAKAALSQVKDIIHGAIDEGDYERAPEEEALYRDDLYKVALAEMIRARGTAMVPEAFSQLGSAAVAVVNSLLEKRWFKLNTEKKAREERSK